MTNNKTAKQNNQLSKITVSLQQKICRCLKVKKIWIFVLLLIVCLWIYRLWDLRYTNQTRLPIFFPSVTTNKTENNISASSHFQTTLKPIVKIQEHNETKPEKFSFDLPKRFLIKLSDDKAPPVNDEFPYPAPDASTLKVDFILKPKPDTCDNLNLVVLVMSALNHFSQRSWIRSYWKKTKPQLGSVTPIFMLGYPSKDENVINAKIANESIEHNDILQGSFIDSYLNVTVKMINGFRWFHDDCRNAKFAFVTDDDVSIYLENLLHFVHKNTSKYDKRLLACGEVYIRDAQIFRSGKFAVPRSRYNSVYYPPYCSGPCFLMSSDAVRKLYLTSRDMHVDIGIADVVVTGIIRVKSHIDLHSQDKPMCKHLGGVPNTMQLLEKALVGS